MHKAVHSISIPIQLLSSTNFSLKTRCYKRIFLKKILIQPFFLKGKDYEFGTKMLLIILQDLFILSGVCSNRAQILGELIKKYKLKFQYENSPDRVIFLNGQTKYIEIGVDKYFLWHWSKSVVGKDFDIPLSHFCRRHS